MAGYDGFSMSNNARAAYDAGLVPASKTGVPAELVRRFVRPAEWHHTSARYNCTHFYDRAEVRATFGLEAHPDFETDPKAVAALAASRAPAAEQVYGPCRVEWIDWGGTRRHPKATPRTENGCRVVVRGSLATITLPGGGTLRKRIGANGFRFITEGGLR
jgi:hypothetical protein